jgi:hypothetical protein
VQVMNLLTNSLLMAPFILFVIGVPALLLAFRHS